MDINTKLFTISANHLLTQNERCVNDGGSCVYRGPDGTKCAIGVLIDDNQYLESFEGEGADNDSVRAAVAASHNVDVDDLNEPMLLALQDVHDVASSVYWRNELLRLATIFRVDWKPRG